MSIFTKPSTRIVAGAAATVTAFGLVLSASVAAHADPGGSFPAPKASDWQAAGSDTLQDVYNEFQRTADIDSWDAFPQPGTITIDGVTLGRPHGSGDGVKALSASHNPASASFTNSDGTYVLQQSPNPTIDIARSSSSPSGSLTWADANSKVVYVPLARDAVSVATYRLSTKTDFTKETISAIYAATTEAAPYDAAPVGAESNGDVRIKVSGTSKQPQVHTGTGWVNIDPLLPQAASGTRSFFQGAIGVNNAQLGTWVDHLQTPGYPENNAGTTVFSGSGDARIIPFSAAQYIAQRNGKASTFNAGTQASVRLASIGGKAAYTLSGTTYSAGPLFGLPTSDPSGFNRDVYSVITKSNFGTGAAPVISTGTLGELVSTTLPGLPAVSAYGFLPLNVNSYTANPAKWKYSNWTN